MTTESATVSSTLLDGLLHAYTTDETSTNPLQTGPRDAEKYGYGTLAVFIISICPLLSVVIAGFQKSPVYKFVIAAMLGLCVGSLVGDTLLHLLPEILGAHSHGGDEHEHEHEHEHESNHTEGGNEGHSEGDARDISYLWKMLVGCASVWGFLVLQLIIQGVGDVIERRSKNMNSSENVFSEIAHTNDAVSIESYKNLKDGRVSQQIGGEAKAPAGSTGGFKTDDDDSLHVHAHSSVAWMVTIGDALHNFTDGLAIGAAFSKSLSSGLATSVAVLCHELPHEFGDAALMLSAGWSYKLVLLLQCLAQVTAFIGLYIGIALSNAFEDAQMWIFAIAAGMFLYVALSDAVPEIIELFRHHKSILIAVLANAGVAVGYLIMALLGVYEEKIVIH